VFVEVKARRGAASVWRSSRFGVEAPAHGAMALDYLAGSGTTRPRRRRRRDRRTGGPE
jgi:hypothetical protein